MADRPPFSVPTMAEISALEPNGYRAVSTFAGGGGSSTGYRMAGFRMLYANEFVGAARETYAANMRPGTILDGRDIREVTAEEILAATDLDVGELDVFDGSPPCAPFSTAGKRSKGWGQVSKYSDTAQRSDDLFFEFARLIEGIQPRVFVAENVSGLVKGSAKGYFRMILARLGEAGYRVSARLLDSQWLGVPQARQRLIFVGVRNDLGVAPRHPSPLPYRYALRDVFPYVSHSGNGGGFGEATLRDSGANPVGTIGASFTSGNGLSPAGLIADADPGWAVHHETSGQFSLGEVTDRPSPTVTVGVNAVNSNHFQVEDPAGQPRVLARNPYEGGDRDLNLDEPSPTVMAHGIGGAANYQTLTTATSSARWEDGVAYDPETGQRISLTTGPLAKAYPELNLRKFTLAELRAVCGFPPDYVLTGKYNQRWERLGRSVPPLMMRAVARSVEEILREADA